jgi:hypothetical protein
MFSGIYLILTLLLGLVFLATLLLSYGGRAQGASPAHPLLTLVSLPLTLVPVVFFLFLMFYRGDRRDLERWAVQRDRATLRPQTVSVVEYKAPDPQARTDDRPASDRARALTDAQFIAWLRQRRDVKSVVIERGRIRIVVDEAGVEVDERELRELAEWTVKQYCVLTPATSAVCHVYVGDEPEPRVTEVQVRAGPPQHTPRTE